MKTATAIRKAIADFDGRSPSPLSEASARFSEEPDYLNALLALAADPEPSISTGATWMLKTALETGAMLSEAQAATLLDKLERITHWQAQLHICQMAGFLTIPGDKVVWFRNWLLPLQHHDRPFLRAWALDALCGLPGAASQTSVRELLEKMAEDPAASVRARVRNLRKSFDGTR